MNSQSAPEASADTSARYLEEWRSQSTQDSLPDSLPAACQDSLLFMALNDPLIHVRHYVSPTQLFPTAPKCPTSPGRLQKTSSPAVPSHHLQHKGPLVAEEEEKRV